MSNKTKYEDYLRVVTDTQNDQYPTMFLYGYIGQKADPYWGEDPEEDITDLAVVKTIKELEAKYSRINIRINSPGGSVMHGDPIITAIRASKAEIHTYNDGIAASMAADIWVSGKYRHAPSNSKTMIHCTLSGALGNARTMRSCAEMLDTFDETAIMCFSEASGMSEAEVKKQFYDYQDHWLTAKDLLKYGLITEIESYPVTEIDNTKTMDWKKLMDEAVRAVVIKPVEEENGFDKENWREDYLKRLAFL